MLIQPSLAIDRWPIPGVAVELGLPVFDNGVTAVGSGGAVVGGAALTTRESYTALVFSDAGAAWFLANAFATGNDLTICLFVANVTPTEASTPASFTEAAGGGYASKTLAGGSWTVGDDGSGVTQASYAQQTWTFSGSLTTNPTIYGYYVVAGSTLIYAEAIDPYTPVRNGDKLQLTPIFKVSKGTPA